MQVAYDVRIEQSNRVCASPLAKRLALKANIAIAGIRGSGPRGRVLSKDVLALATSNSRITPSCDQVMKRPDDSLLNFFPDDSYSEIPHDEIRKIIARRLCEAKSTIPHFYLSLDCHIDELLDLRAKLNSIAPKSQDGQPAYKISVNDLVVKAYALALKTVPQANASWTEKAILYHNSADIGVAVSLPGGVITPIVKDALNKPLSVLSNEIRLLSKLARNKKLKPEQYQGGTTVVSNLGMFGVKSFAAIVNPPHATILAVGAGTQQPVIVDGKIEIATVLTLTLSTDHRVIDGALAAELIRATKSNLENPMSMLV